MVRALQLAFGGILIVTGLYGIAPMLIMRQSEITMYGVLYLGILLVGLDVFGRGLSR